jgi:hypothetical protein
MRRLQVLLAILRIVLSRSKCKEVNMFNFLRKKKETEELKTALSNLVKACEKWAKDEDGIHPDAWIAYKRAKRLCDKEI